ncbi:hypothetical protein ABK040_011986 [Willaertia magna]
MPSTPSHGFSWFAQVKQYQNMNINPSFVKDRKKGFIGSPFWIFSFGYLLLSFAFIGLLVGFVLVDAKSNTKNQPTFSTTEEYNCRFAMDYTINDLLKDPLKRSQFLKNVSFWEGKFAVHGIGLNLFSGMTYDGHQIDYQTSQRHDPLHAFSASSKESIHLNLMASALDGNSFARDFFKSSMNAMNQTEKDIDMWILTILDRKLTSYESFDRQYPGFGSLLPWFEVNDKGCALLWDWLDRIPSLDNGQLIWGLIGLEQVMREKGIGLQLADRISAKLMKIKRTVIPMFYESNGNIRCVATIKNVHGSPYNETNYIADGSCYLDDPYEGELMAFFMDLLADWESAGYKQDEREKIWIAKRPKLRAVTYHSKTKGDILVEEGYWYSSHEKWKYLVLPYIDIPINQKVFMNGEKARLINSIEKKIPGLMASVTLPTKPGDYNPGYASACGIPSIASQHVDYQNVVTPYGSFPAILANQTIGLTWYLTMLQGSKMQGIHGSTESTNTTGTAICPVVTWDSKITTMAAITGGIIDYTRNYMKQKGLYNRFYKIVDIEWNRVFERNGPLPGELIRFDDLVPSIAIPRNSMDDFSLCRYPN